MTAHQYRRNASPVQVLAHFPVCKSERENCQKIGNPLTRSQLVIVGAAYSSILTMRHNKPVHLNYTYEYEFT